MLTTLEINRFRCFKHFKLSGLKRINLFVGQNNSGKTSILEAIKLLYSQAKLSDFLEISLSRDEYDFHIKEFHSADFNSLFFDRNPDDGSFFTIIGTKDNDKDEILRLKAIVRYNYKESLGDMQYEICTEIGSNSNLVHETEFLLYGNNIDKKNPSKKHYMPNLETSFIPSKSLSTNKMIDLFNELVLTPREELVIKALQSIDCSIERIAPINFNGYGSFLVKVRDCNLQIPIGSMGDGVYRILGLALSIANTKDGILLVDEIDTGLHYTAMDDMWKMILQTANDLNVQVFATTHSNDCWQSLAEIAGTLDDNSDGIAIHRIEKGHDRSIVYTEKQMQKAAERDIEVR